MPAYGLVLSIAGPLAGRVMDMKSDMIVSKCVRLWMIKNNNNIFDQTYFDQTYFEIDLINHMSNTVDDMPVAGLE